jgi:hypothetical protein
MIAFRLRAPFARPARAFTPQTSPTATSHYPAVALAHTIPATPENYTGLQ